MLSTPLRTPCTKLYVTGWGASTCVTTSTATAGACNGDVPTAAVVNVFKPFSCLCSMEREIYRLRSLPTGAEWNIREPPRVLDIKHPTVSLACTYSDAREGKAKTRERQFNRWSGYCYVFMYVFIVFLSRQFPLWLCTISGGRRRSWCIRDVLKKSNNSLDYYKIG